MKKAMFIILAVCASMLLLFNAPVLAEEQYLSISEAAVFLREAMVNRETEISVYVRSQEELDGDSFEELYMNAVSHNGNSSEGDYIRRNIIEQLNYYTETGIVEGEHHYCANYSISYRTNKAEEDYVEERTSQIIEELALDGLSDYDKVVAIYGYVCDHVTYDNEHVNDPDYQRMHTAYAALFDGTAVCDGYALLMYNLCNRAGIDCRLIAGEAGSFIPMFENHFGHAWNIVCIDGKYYNIDATWDSGNSVYSNFLQTDESFSSVISARHIRYEEFTTEEFVAAYPMGEDDLENPTLIGAHGYFGAANDNLEWSISGNGHLIISGTGPMNEFDAFNIRLPWEGYENTIRTIEIRNGVTTVGRRAFLSCRSLQRVSLPDSVESIGEEAFWNCQSLTSIAIPDSVRTIGETCFACCYSLKNVQFSHNMSTISSLCFTGCSGLERITIPEGITSIGSEAFSTCTSLFEVNIPSTLVSIGVGAFNGAPLSNFLIPANVSSIGGGAFSGRGSPTIAIDPANPYYTAVESVIYSKDMKVLVSYIDQDGRASFVIPEGVEEIADQAFDSCFYLRESIVFPSSLKKIGYRSFCSCYFENYDFPFGLIEIGKQAFENNVFLTELECPESVATLGDGCFMGCYRLESVSLPRTLRAIPAMCFVNCSALSHIDLPDECLVEIGGQAFQGTGIVSMEVPECVESVKDYAFWGCSNLQSVNIRGNIGVISNSTFYDCSALSSIQFTNSVKAIEREAFSGCQSLTDIWFVGTAQQWDAVSKGENWNLGCPGSQTIHFMTGITIDDAIEHGTITVNPTSGAAGDVVSVEGVGEPGYSLCELYIQYTDENGQTVRILLDELQFTIPANVECVECQAVFRALVGNIDQGAPSYELDLTGETSQTSIQLGANYYDTGDEVLFVSWSSSDPGIVAVSDSGLAAAVSVGSATVCGTAEDATIISWTIVVSSIPTFGNASFILPAGQLTIDAYAFEGDIAITAVDASACTSLGTGAFSGCTGLTKIRLPMDCSIEDTAFDECTSLVAIFGPAGGTTEQWANDHMILFVAE